MKSLRRLVPAPIRSVGRRFVDGVRARRSWHRMLREARQPPELRRTGNGAHVCLLAWSFPPLVAGGTYRPLALVKYGTELGLSFTVISCPFHQTPSAAGRFLSKQVPPDARVIRTALPQLRPSRGALPDLDGGALNVLEIWRSATQALDPEPPDLVVATGPPFHTFVAGSLLARRYRVPLVLEYRDEWTECPFDFVHSGADDRRWEARCLEAAHLVLFTTQSQLEHQLGVFAGLSRDRCEVVPNGWEPGYAVDAARPPQEGRPDDARCTVSFTGNLGDHTLPGSFLDCLADVVRRRPDLAHRFSFRFVGQKSENARSQLDRFPEPAMIESVDQVPKDAVTGIQRESGGLLLLNAPELERYLPGKLYEYLASGRPILVYGTGGEVGSLVAGLSAGPVIAADDPAALTDALEEIANSAVDAAVTPERAEWLQRHTRRRMSQRTVGLLERLMADSAAASSEAE